MYPYPPVDYQQIDLLQKTIQQQMERLNEVEKELEQLKKDLSQASKRKPVQIERVEYHFDQLKIETLEGTLNIGFTPQQDSAFIDDLSLGQQVKEAPVLQNPLQKNVFARVRRRVYHFLDARAPEEISKLEDKYSTVLGQTYREQMIADLRKQVDKRIGYYIHRQTLTSEHQEQVEQQVYEQTVTDVLQALERHFKQLKGEDVT